MIYELPIPIPKNTPVSSPAEVVLPIHPGHLTQVSVYFPPGPSGLAHVTIWYWERQFWPSNPDSDFTGDDLLITFPEDLDLIDPPFEFVIKGWNEDDTFQHSPIIRLQVTPFGRSVQDVLRALTTGPAGPITPVE